MMELIPIDGRSHAPVQQAGREFGIDGTYVTRLIKAGKLRGRRLGHYWIVDVEDLRRRIENMRGGRTNLRSESRFV